MFVSVSLCVCVCVCACTCVCVSCTLVLQGVAGQVEGVQGRGRVMTEGTGQLLSKVTEKETRDLGYCLVFTCVSGCVRACMCVCGFAC